MATPASGAKKKPASKSAATATKTTVTTSTTKKRVFTKVDGTPNYPAIIIAEVVGTFAITLVALLALQQFSALFVGLTYAALILALGAVSGSHLNPAVTFGLWTARKLKTALLPVYWVAQFIGAILAVMLIGSMSGRGVGIDLSHFGAFSWNVMLIELIGAAVLLFGVVAVINKYDTLSGSRAIGVGLSLMVALLVSSSAFTALQTGKTDEYQSAASSTTVDETTGEVANAAVPRELYINGAVLNPAVALAVTERTDNQIMYGQAATADEAQYSRFSLETIIGALAGAAIGANLALVMLAPRRNS